jgi:hypothetical protein
MVVAARFSLPVLDRSGGGAGVCRFGDEPEAIRLTPVPSIARWVPLIFAISQPGGAS